MNKIQTNKYESIKQVILKLYTNHLCTVIIKFNPYSHIKYSTISII